MYDEFIFSVQKKTKRKFPAGKLVAQNLWAPGARRSGLWFFAPFPLGRDSETILGRNSIFFIFTNTRLKSSKI